MVDTNEISGLLARCRAATTDLAVCEAIEWLSGVQDRHALLRIISDGLCAAPLRCEAADCYVERAREQGAVGELEALFRRLSGDEDRDEEVQAWFRVIWRHFRGTGTGVPPEGDETVALRARGAVHTRGGVRSRGASPDELPIGGAATPRLGPRVAWLDSLAD